MKGFNWLARRTQYRSLTDKLQAAFAVFGAAVLLLWFAAPALERAQADEAALIAGEVEPTALNLNARQRMLTRYIARKYRVADEVVGQLVHEAHLAGRQTGLDPLLLLAVMAVESSFNPIAESGFGAKGLMQVVPRFHYDKLADHGGEEAILEPRTNILVGAQILKSYMRQTGSLEAGLQLYGGAADDPESAYAAKVLAEQERLRRALGFNTAQAKI